MEEDLGTWFVLFICLSQNIGIENSLGQKKKKKKIVWVNDDSYGDDN